MRGPAKARPGLQGQVPPQGRRFPLPPPAAHPTPAEASASGPVSDAWPWAPRGRAGWGEWRGAGRFKLPERPRRAPPFPEPQTARRPGCQGPPARLRTHIGRYSHGDAFGPGRAAGKLSDPHRQRGPGRGGRAARRGSAPPVRARAAVPRASLRGARARLSTAPAGPGARCSQAAAGPCGRRAPRLSPPPPPLHTAGAGAADPGERWQLCALSRHLGELEAPAPSA